MALPKLNVINHNLNLPSTGKELTYRPFLVKEEKMLMMAMESGEPKDMIRATRDIITSCVEDNIDVNNLPMFDIEYIFLQLRAKSIGDITTISYTLGDEDKCSKNKDKSCTYSTEIDLNTVTINKNKDHKDTIDLTNNIKIKMRYPEIEASTNIVGLEGEDLVNKTFEMIGNCIEYILEDEEMHSTKDYTSKEVEEFLNSLTSAQFRNIQNFFDTMPKLQKEIIAKCTVCGKKNTKVLEGLADFF